MKYSWISGVVLALCAVPVAAGTPEPAASRTQPMQFVLQEPTAATCGKECRQLVFASGMITADTPRRFEAFAAERTLKGAMVVLDSDGGSVLGALALGRAIRRLGLDTTVGRRVLQAPGSAPAGIAPASCESMCPFVLLGGVKREVPAKSRVLVHQIWLGDRRDDAVAASYTAEDLMLVQRDIGQIVRYTAEMGGSAELIEIALRVPPWEPMRALSPDEIRRAKLDLDEEPKVSSQTSATVSPVATASLGRTDAQNERGWTLVDDENGTSLSRRHPLTFEGERIGSFDIAISCGDTAGNYTLSYTERRQSGGGTVDRANLWIEQNELPLTVKSSRLSGRQLETAAVVSVPAGLIRAFASNVNHSVSVQTVSSGSPLVATRIGNAGTVKSFAQLETSCSSRGHSRDAHARLEAQAH